MDRPSEFLEDKEKQDEVFVSTQEAGRPSSSYHVENFSQRLKSWVLKQGLHSHGIEPTTLDQRTDTRVYQMFFLWFSANLDIQAFAAASVAPAVFGLGIRTSFLVVIIVDFVACIVPAYFAVFGPRLGMHGVVMSRFSWGYYGGLIPSFFNLCTMQGYLIINCIIGGQTLAASSSHLDATLGIVIIGLIALLVTFSGYQVLHWYETIAWIPNVVGMIVMAAVGSKSLATLPLGDPSPATAASIMTFAAALAAGIIGWSPIVPDYGIFHDHQARGISVFLYTYLGLLLSSLPIHLLGVSFTAGALYIPEWNAGLGEDNNVGGLVGAIFAPTGNFGKALLVLMALTTPSASTPTMHSVCTSLMTFSPVFAKVPRCFIAIVSTAILIPVAIIGAKRFFDTLLQVLSLMGYWLGPFVAIVLTEHFVFRRTWSSYQPSVAWNNPSHPNLARGLAAVFTFTVAIGLIILCMDQQWWTGPVANSGTGDIAMLVSFGSSVVTYYITRSIELRWFNGDGVE